MLAAAALDAHEAFVRDAVFPEALRYAKQLRYDGYKIVLVTAAPAEALKPLGRAMGASRVIGAEAGSDLATTPDGRGWPSSVRFLRCRDASDGGRGEVTSGQKSRN